MKFHSTAKPLLSLLIVLTGVLHAQKPGIIPQPVSMQLMKGEFVIDANTSIRYQNQATALRTAASLLQEHIKNLSGKTIASNTAKSKPIEFKLGSFAEIGNEGYLLNVTPLKITISANSNAGIAYGVQSIIQLITKNSNGTVVIPAVNVKDYPRFRYRGMHLDVCRHMFPVSFVKKYIDFLNAYKFNYFHWHLTDDQGWRIEIKKYPELTTEAATRFGTIIGHHPGTGNTNLRYGGFYTQDEVKDIVAYATARNITVVPEIEMPGHASAAIAAYPYLSCFPQRPTPVEPVFSARSKSMQAAGKTKFVQETWGVFDDIFCAGNDSTFTFLQDVLNEVLTLFPSKYIHVGGDEAPKTHWKECKLCQQRIKRENLKDEHGLQSYFITRMEKYLNLRGRTIIGWDEILEGGLAPNAVVMSWRGEQGGIEAARQNHDVIMTPGNPVYFDHFQGDPAKEPLSIGGNNTLKKVYDYDPIPKELDEAQQKYIMGAQANLWTEYVSSPQHAEYMVLPRMLALSEAVWSPKALKNFEDFNRRLSKHYWWFDRKGWNYFREEYE